MSNIHNFLCGVIPQHMLIHVAEQDAGAAGRNARATLDEMRELANGHGREPALIQRAPGPKRPGTSRWVYDAQQQYILPGKLVANEHRQPQAGMVGDVQAVEAFDGCGATTGFFAKVFGRRSIDGRDMPLVVTVHYGTGFQNAMWNGHQMIFGDGDGILFNRFTGPLEVIGHELTHAVTQHAAGLGYSGQAGALNEHFADAFGLMVKQYALGLHAGNSNWLIGDGLFGPAVKGKAIRSMAAPGTAYDDPLLGRDPQPRHMRDYVETADDHGGVHINSGILNYAFCRAAQMLGGPPWGILGRIWYAALTERVGPHTSFQEFACITVALAGELFGVLGRAQRILIKAWNAVGLPVTVYQRPPSLLCGGNPAPVVVADGQPQH